VQLPLHGRRSNVKLLKLNGKVTTSMTKINVYISKIQFTYLNIP